MAGLDKLDRREGGLDRRGGGPDRRAAGVTPAEARTASLAALVGAAEGLPGWFVVPPHGGEEAYVVVPMAERTAFLAALAAAPGPAYLTLVEPAWGGWPERRSAEPADFARGRTPALRLEPAPPADGRPGLIDGCGTRVELWETGPDGDLHPTLPSPWVTRVAPDAATEPITVAGVAARTLPLMAGPSVDDVTFDVDAVLTWVDGADPAWQQRRDARLAGLAELGGRVDRRAGGEARYLDRDELRHAMRAIHLFAPWIRTIHLVTDGQLPGWLDADHPRIHLVDHREILPAEALPTFNSQAIETGLHRIPGLAEHFLYLNDDMFLGRPTRPEQWFSPARRRPRSPRPG